MAPLIPLVILIFCLNTTQAISAQCDVFLDASFGKLSKKLNLFQEPGISSHYFMLGDVKKYAYFHLRYDDWSEKFYYQLRIPLNSRDELDKVTELILAKPTTFS